VAEHRLGTPLGIPVHPFPVYAFFFNLALYLVLAWLYSRRPSPGRVLATYLVLYGTARFLLELTRGDAARGFVLDGLLSTSQLIGAVLVAIGIGLHLWIGRKGDRGASSPARTTPTSRRGSQKRDGARAR